MTTTPKPDRDVPTIPLANAFKYPFTPVRYVHAGSLNVNKSHQPTVKQEIPDSEAPDEGSDDEGVDIDWPSTGACFDLDPTEDAGIIFPPTDLESDEPQLETYLHLRQLLLLIKCLDWWWRDRNDYFAAGNLTVYYSLDKIKKRDFVGPDFFVVQNTERKPRKSWMVWVEDGRYPEFIVELLSIATAKVDRGPKKLLYQNIFRTPEYFWFSPNTLEFEGFHLVDSVYEPIPQTEQGWMWSQQLQLYLGVQGDYLRFFTPDGELVPTPEESALTELQNVTQAQEQATQAQEQAVQAQKQAIQAEEQALQAQKQAIQAQERVATLEALLAQYRDRFGDLSDLDDRPIQEVNP